MPPFAVEYWPETASRVEFFPASKPPDLPATVVKIYIFRDDALLLAHIRGRGWDLPGGHVESGESPEDATTRELYEETGARVDRRVLIGYLRITNKKEELETGRNIRYPRVSCILVYKGWDVAFDEGYRPQLESTAVKFIPRGQLPTLHHDWSEQKAEVVAYAAAYSGTLPGHQVATH